MTIPTHAPWCVNTSQDHAVCQWQVAAIELVDVQTLTVALYKAQGVSPIITLNHQVGGRSRLIALTQVTARELAASLNTAAEMLA